MFYNIFKRKNVTTIIVQHRETSRRYKETWPGVQNPFNTNWLLGLYFKSMFLFPTLLGRIGTVILGLTSFFIENSNSILKRLLTFFLKEDIVPRFSAYPKIKVNQLSNNPTLSAN